MLEINLNAGPQETLLSVVGRQNFALFGRVTRHDNLS